ncbi:MAG TPA: FAD-dependent oxidoreductase, partial [Pyrinomonadaceae bacterium]|nr:FAD-dependent oxidoreductase [Pyrinomonadaceae bacterium]
MAKPRVLILGGGFGGLFTTLDLAGWAHVTLVSDDDHFLFTPMLYEYLSGEVEAWHIAPRFNELVDENEVRLIKDEVTSIDLDARRVTLDKFKDPVEFDVLLLAVGGISNYAGVEGAEEFSLPFRKIPHADALRRRMVDALDRIPPDLPPQDVRRDLTFVVVGAGASGCELSTKMSDLLRDAVKRRALRGEPRVLVFEMGDRVVPGMGEQIREFVDDALREANVEVNTLTRVVRVTSESVTFEHEGIREELKTAGVVWTGGVKMRPLVEYLNVEKTSRGLIKVRPTLQLAQHDDVFALGDIAC